MPEAIDKLRDVHFRALVAQEDATYLAILATYRRVRDEAMGRLRILDAEGRMGTFTAVHLAATIQQLDDALTLADPIMGTSLREHTTAGGTIGAAQTYAETALLVKAFEDAEVVAKLAQVGPIIPIEAVGNIADSQALLFRDLQGRVVPVVAEKLAESVTLGESTAAAARRLGTAMDGERWQLERIARTEINNAFNAGHAAQITDTATRFPEMSIKRQWSSYRDARTSALCRYLDGQVREHDQPFSGPTWSGDYPPAHPNCRSRVNPWNERWGGKQPRTEEQIAADEAAWQAEHKHVADCCEEATTMARTVERKAISLEFKADPETGTFSGYAAVFGNVDSYGDIIAPGAFKASLERLRAEGKMVPVLWQHDTDKPIGVCDPADLEEDAIGLRVKKAVLVQGVQLADEARALMLARAVDAMSIGFMVTSKGTAPTGAKRLLTGIDLWEFSPVTFPANTKAIISEVKTDMKTAAETKAPTFGAVLNRIETEEELQELWWDARQAIAEVLYRIYCDEDMTDDAKISAARVALADFGATMERWLTSKLAVDAAMNATGGTETKAAETKAGKTHSLATIKALTKALECHDKGMAMHAEGCKAVKELLGVEDDPETPDPETSSAPSPEAKAALAALRAIATPNPLTALRQASKAS